MFLGLRLMRGVSRSGFKARFGVSMDEIYAGVIADMTSKGMLSSSGNGDVIRLTEAGLDVCNYVLSGFIL